jgi:hypothetical protein
MKQCVGSARFRRAFVPSNLYSRDASKHEKNKNRARRVPLPAGRRPTRNFFTQPFAAVPEFGRTDARVLDVLVASSRHR